MPSPNKPGSREEAPLLGDPPSAITHAERVVYPDCGVTKGDIARYYEAAAARMAPHLETRLVSLVRAPENIEAELFYQRHPIKGATDGVIPVETNGETYMALRGAEGLRTAAQFGALEIHGWMARYDQIETPDRMVFDLDPAEDVGFSEVRGAALAVRDRLQALGLRSFPMITGGKGVHVTLPLDRALTWSDTEIFAAGFAQSLAHEEPQRFVATMSKKLRQGRIFIDWLRNARAATAILPWSLRARPGAPVAVPLTWESLAATESAKAFTLKTALDAPDAWPDFFSTPQTIAAEALAAMRGA